MPASVVRAPRVCERMQSKYETKLCTEKPSKLLHEANHFQRNFNENKKNPFRNYI